MTSATKHIKLSYPRDQDRTVAVFTAIAGVPQCTPLHSLYRGMSSLVLLRLRFQLESSHTEIDQRVLTVLASTWQSL
ncbi:hypothetical protein OBBRIDRAFT_792254 [Obba rivulosa]|uniref:Uncharacterized protein n=1 Tax=Obba rivulosa TaxID=1052685 RepID=A0A8E2DLV6_9APHY|nr:hypothetical protein OBBRIDRAFT_792254 [Obba rivulosa]